MVSGLMCTEFRRKNLEKSGEKWGESGILRGFQQGSARVVGLASRLDGMRLKT
jgi:hypothetical protein